MTVQPGFISAAERNAFRFGLRHAVATLALLISFSAALVLPNQYYCEFRGKRLPVRMIEGYGAGCEFFEPPPSPPFADRRVQLRVVIAVGGLVVALVALSGGRPGHKRQDPFPSVAG